MSDLPEQQGAAWAEKSLGENSFLKFVQRPRIMLILLGGWAIVGFLTELFTSNALFLENHAQGELALDGVLGGRALGWEGIPLAALYFYCARDPERYQRVFWLALIEQAAAIAANFYHWLVTDDFSFESIAIPVGVAFALEFLVFLHLFARREPEPAPA
jgi:hypothetical protein